MTEGTLVALLSLVGAVLVAGIGAVGVVLGLLWRRIGKLEARERATWWWARLIADMYYRHREHGAPDLPPPPHTQEGEPT